MLSLFLSIAATWYGVRAISAATAKRRQKARLRRLGLRELDAAPPRPPGLSPSMIRVWQESRQLRLLLEVPLRRLGDGGNWLESPWERRRRSSEYDLALLEARRALWDWMRSLFALGPSEHALLEARGLNMGTFRRALFGALDRTPDPSDPWDQSLWSPLPDPERVLTELRRLLEELRRFEEILFEARSTPYRLGAA